MAGNSLQPAKRCLYTVHLSLVKKLQGMAFISIMLPPFSKYWLSKSVRLWFRCPDSAVASSSVTFINKLLQQLPQLVQSICGAMVSFNSKTNLSISLSSFVFKKALKPSLLASLASASCPILIKSFSMMYALSVICKSRVIYLYFNQYKKMQPFIPSMIAVSLGGLGVCVNVV